MKETIECGVIKGELCGRNDCPGIIDEYEKEGGCSCHINPPCGYCTTDASYCPICGWEPSDDVKPVDLEVQKRNQEYYEKQNKEWAESRAMFYKRFSGKEPIEKLEIRSESHTHFTQKQIGVFPKGTETRETILPKVKGTFGGRFVRFDDFRFEYIAYTD